MVLPIHQDVHLCAGVDAEAQTKQVYMTDLTRNATWSCAGPRRREATQRTEGGWVTGAIPAEFRSLCARSKKDGWKLRENVKAPNR